MGFGFFLHKIRYFSKNGNVFVVGLKKDLHLCKINEVDNN